MVMVGICADFIKCYRIALNIRADRHLYGHLYGHLIIAHRWKNLQKLSHQSREYFNRFIGGCKTVEEIEGEGTPTQGFGRI